MERQGGDVEREGGDVEKWGSGGWGEERGDGDWPKLKLRWKGSTLPLRPQRKHYIAEFEMKMSVESTILHFC